MIMKLLRMTHREVGLHTDEIALSLNDASDERKYCDKKVLK
jgi:hypothetical protein